MRLYVEAPLLVADGGGPWPLAASFRRELARHGREIVVLTPDAHPTSAWEWLDYHGLEAYVAEVRLAPYPGDPARRVTARDLAESDPVAPFESLVHRLIHEGTSHDDNLPAPTGRRPA